MVVDLKNVELLLR